MTTDTAHEVAAAEIAASFIAECWEPAEVAADPKGAKLWGEYKADQQLGAWHAGDCCPVCHPPGQQWWKDEPQPEPTPEPVEPDADSWGGTCWICDAQHERIGPDGTGCPYCGAREW